MVVEAKPATTAADAVIAELRVTLDAGGGLYAASHALAESMGNAAILRLWKERGGQFLYDMARTHVREQRQTAGMPSGYSGDRTEYKREAIEHVLSSYIGVLAGDKLQYRAMGELDVEGCQGAAANHETQAAGNLRQAEKFREFAAALAPGETLNALDREVLIRIWWGEPAEATA